MSDFTHKKAGNYNILEKLGDGGFATVFLAQHSVLEKKAAIKFMLEDWVDEPEVVARFFDEARTMERLHQHPNIVKILDIATQEKCASEGLPPYFIMEYIEGRSLEEFMKSEEGFTMDDVRRIMSCCLSALQHCHDLAVVHRDIKPSNILIRTDGEVRLTDFGIAKARKNTSKTGEGLTLGSTDYMSPEQALGKRDLDYRSDIYSLGITLYQMVCDRLPFIGDSPNSVALKHIQERPVAPIEINPAVSPRLNEIILKAIEKEREHRFQSCKQMLEALENLDSEEEEEVEVDVASVDLTEAVPEEDDDNFLHDYHSETSSHTASKFASQPPPSLIHGIRVALIVLAFTGIFLGAFKGYYLLTQAKVHLKSRPLGASVYLNGEIVGSSPIELTLPPNGYLISIAKEGYATSTVYFDMVARQRLHLDKRLNEIDHDAATFESSLEKLKALTAGIPSKNIRTKKDQERYDRAMAALAKEWKNFTPILEKEADYVKPNLDFIQFCEQTGNLDRAEKYYELLAKKNPSAAAFTFAGIVQQHKNANKEALKLFMEAWTIDPNYRFLLNTLGDFFMKDGKATKAKQYLEMSLFLYPEQKEIRKKVEALK